MSTSSGTPAASKPSTTRTRWASPGAYPPSASGAVHPLPASSAIRSGGSSTSAASSSSLSVGWVAASSIQLRRPDGQLEEGQDVGPLLDQLVNGLAEPVAGVRVDP